MKIISIPSFPHLFTTLKRFFLFVLMLISVQISFAQQSTQISISNPNGLNVCDAAQSVKVKIRNISANVLVDNTITINLPTGIEYSTTSLEEQSDYNIQEKNTSNLSSFTLTADDLPIDSSFVFSFKILANMDAITFQDEGNTLRNEVTITSAETSTTSLSNTYNLYYPVLLITKVTPSSKEMIGGETFTRKITLTNTGSGRVSAFNLYDEHIEGIDISSVNVGTLNSNKNKILLAGSDFSSIGNHDNYFDSNEKIIIKETISISSCDASSIKSTITNDWTCGSKTITSSNSYAYVNIALKKPNLKITTSESLDACFGNGSSSIQTFTIKNTGQGIAKNIKLDIYKSNGAAYNQDIFSSIKTSSITLKLGKESPVAIIPSETFTTKNTGRYSCLGANPTGRIVLDLPDLKKGKKMVITFETNHCNIDVCQGDLVKGWSYILNYEDACHVDSYEDGDRGQTANETYMSIFPETPTDINNGQTKEFVYTVSSHKNDLPMEAGAKYKVVFDLPAGLKYENLEFYHNNEWPAASIDYNTTTNQVVAIYELPAPSDFHITKASFNLNLKGDCSMSNAQDGLLQVGLNISYITSENCTDEIPFICDQSSLIDLHCGDNICEGMNFKEFTFERTSFGIADNNQDGLPDENGSLDFNRIKTNRVMFGDTIRGSFTGLVYTSSANTNWSYGYAIQNIEKGTYLTPISAALKIYDKSTNSYLSCNNIAVSTATNGLDKTFRYNISPSAIQTCTGFENFIYEQGDSVWVFADYKVTTNIGGNIEQLKSLNEYYLSNIENPSQDNQYQCDYYNDNYTLIGYFFKNGGRTYSTVKSCSKKVQQNFYLSIGDIGSNYNGGNLFPAEYRNWAHIKTATLEVPDNYELGTVYMKIYRTEATNESVLETQYDIVPIAVDGNLYTFDLEQYYNEYGGSLNFSDDGFKGRLYAELSPNCDVPINTYQDVIWKFSFAKAPIIGGQETELIKANKKDRVRFNPPSLSLTSNNPVIEGVSKTILWDLKVRTNAPSVDANNVWIHIKNPSNKVHIIEVIDNETGAPLDLVGDIYQLGILDGSNERDLTIKAEYRTCIPDYITVYSGYECTGYPTSFNDFHCDFTTIGLFVKPKPADLQATISGQDVGDECSSMVEVEIDVASVNLGAVDSILITITPVGNSTTFENGSGQLAYPLSNPYQSIDDPIFENGAYHYAMINLDTTIASNGLPGILDENNHFKMKFNMVLDETFKAGDYVNVRIQGQAMCGTKTSQINLSFDPSVGSELVAGSGLTMSVINSWSASWGDYNNDGYDDLFVTSKDLEIPNSLYKNNGDKTFTKITTGAIVTDLARSVSSTWGDYDNDGYVDLFVANNYGSPNFLYHNNGNSTFTKVTSGDIVEQGTYCHSAAWADYDNDGFLDLFVSEFFPSNANHLFHNNGDGTFKAVENSPVVLDKGHSIGASWSDYNNDGLVDLFVPNTRNESNWLYKNMGDGVFEKVNDNVLSSPSSSVGVSWGDYNNDGFSDLFVANSGNANNALYKNNQDGTFSMVTDGPVVSDHGHSHGSSWIDIDNDGDLDLYVTNDQGQDNFLYKNNGDGTFMKVENDLTRIGGESFGTAISDYDNDGDYDVFVANHGSSTDFLFENTKGQCSEYLCLNLIGTNSNTCAIGAKVRVKANIFGKDVWQLHEVVGQSGGGAGGQNSNNVIIGLGNATLVDSLIIEWPSGFTKVYTDLLTTTSNCNIYQEENTALITGRAYIDANANCQLDEGETYLKGVAITIEGQETFTNKEGQFSFSMKKGTYTVSAKTPEHLMSNCDSEIAIKITQIDTNYANNNFGFIATESNPDLSACLSTTALKLNSTSDYIIVYENTGNSIAKDNTIVLKLAEGIEYISSSLPITKKDGQTFTWHFDAIQPQESGTFNVTVSVNDKASWDKYVTNSVSITTASKDIDESNNTCNDTELIVDSIAPNVKLVYPQNTVEPSGSLTYKIRFQNTGNAPVENVVIYDTLTTLLDPSSINHLLSSHEGIFSVIDKHILKWEFKNINLPDSTANKAQSHGFVQFNILPRQNIADKSLIENRATIIFDYDQITPTNTTSVTVKPSYTSQPEALGLIVSPQPTDGYLVVQYESKKDESITIQFYSATGNLLLASQKDIESGWNDLEYDLGQFKAGSYFMVIISSEGIVKRKIILM